jgi:hypothetical protein
MNLCACGSELADFIGLLSPVIMDTMISRYNKTFDSKCFVNRHCGGEREREREEGGKKI